MCVCDAASCDPIHYLKRAMFTVGILKCHFLTISTSETPLQSQICTASTHFLIIWIRLCPMETYFLCSASSRDPNDVLYAGIYSFMGNCLCMSVG